MAQYTQFIRQSEILLANDAQALDVSQFRCTFEIKQMDCESPNHCILKIYNLSETTKSLIQKQYTKLVINAGYKNGNVGQVFSGDIKQFYKGRESNVESYLEVMAADGDFAYNFGFANQTLGPNSTPQQAAQAAANAAGLALDPTATSLLAPMAISGGVLARGKVLFGLARALLRKTAQTNRMRWSIQNGVVKFIPDNGYLPGTVIPVNSKTGMIGFPTATDEGVVVRCLLNPAIQIGTLIQINNADIGQYSLAAGQSAFVGFPNFSSKQFPAFTSNDGFYRVVVHEIKGDTRGHDWYSDLICLLVDKSDPASPVAVG